MTACIIKKLSLYSKYKQKFEVLSYTDLPFRDRQIISKILCISHKLKVETGRHTIPYTPREERICNLCTLNKVEDEEHFIVECSAYEKLRSEHFSQKKYLTAVEILTQEDPATVASFLRKAYALRDQILEEPPEKYHVAQKRGLKMVIRKGPKIGLVCNVTKDGSKIKILSLQ